MGRKRTVALTVGAASIAAWAASKAMSKSIPRTEKKALNFDSPIVLANRGGLLEAPEHTNAAFSHSASYGVHGFAVDIRLTKDEQIVVFHDEYVNRTTNLEGKLADYSLSEIKEADAGYHFKDKNGEFPYRGKGETVLSLKELLEQFPHLFICINIQETPDTYEGSLIPSKLWYLIEELGAEDRLAVTSAFDEQVDRFNLYAQNRVAIGAGNREIKKAYTAFTSQFGHFYQPTTDLFCCPHKMGIFSIGRAGFINFLSKLNIPIYFTDVDEPDNITTLINAGAAGFITDQPTVMMKTIQNAVAE
ncbi:glycerophosphodiester phosphodiesterase family protein [Sporosarcina pasteurii]|uniref:Glycerophosphoryl diester phosphodiesterase n=1 Tax=Sporosarcina pasteurii TaxID=1474 RepID=A0A380BH37_SPOPA|nr:glycerophosphodiester phosphodiesterase family protein [Sporosarcina pasteurii]MDS9470471.1 glycerophosphodiester phosphodiesterase family protein [Sporosarcina pasteurii]QBQ05831.1 glycerophosphodiester phosphodiesterase [Sporosarcina pasteurii]SUJ00285.1 Glycerophosphoryl diester phosphodiesterase [Sporosarcina pasteurii]